MENEELREALLNLERSRNRERQLRIETEGLLQGLRILTRSKDTQDVFVRLLKVLKELIAFDDAFILREQIGNDMHTVVCTDPLFENCRWKAGKKFDRVLAGSPLIMFNLNKASEWRRQPGEIRQLAVSALHAPIETLNPRAMLVCVSRKKAFFNRQHANLLQRFTPLASQALQNMENNEKLRLTIQESNALARKAEEASQAKSDFLAKMSHEIRTPLNGIIGMAEAALGTRLDDKQERILNIIDQESNHLLHVINNILDFSKIEAGRLEVESARMHLGQLFNAVGESIALRASHKGVELNVYLSPETPENLLGDSTRLRQVLVNLASNAVKFTQEGSVSIKGELLEKNDSQVKLRFSVEDTGIGIPMEKQKTIFEEFAQVDSSITRKYGGTGLGTTISKQLVELMGGVVHLESRPGQGTVVWFELSFELPEGWSEVQKRSHNWNELRVLVVDDCNISRSILTKYLKTNGCRVVEVENGHKALDAIKAAQVANDPINLMITDFRMPEMSGYELAKKVRTMNKGQQMPIIAVSGLQEFLDEENPENMGFDFCVPKPLNIEDLTSAVQAASGMVPKESATYSPTIHQQNENQPTAVDVKVLLVDDYLTNQQVAHMHLSSIGYQVDMADNGEKAIEMFRDGDYDVILMDLEMPVMDGFETTQSIRKLEGEYLSMKQTPIIALTAHALKGQEEKCLRSGMDDFMTKPLRRRQLLETLSKWLPVSKQQNSLPAQSASAAKPHRIGDNENADRPMDWSQALEEFMGQKELLFEIITAFLSQADGQVGRLKEALSDGDVETVRKQAHALKGGAANLTAWKMSTAASDLEEIAKAGVLDGGEEILDALVSELDRLILYVERKR